MTERIGDYFVRLEMLSFEQAERIMEVQKRQPALELGYIDSTDLETYEQYCLSGECP
jgi:hypothetical protein